MPERRYVTKRILNKETGIFAYTADERTVKEVLAQGTTFRMPWLDLTCP